MVPEDAQFYYCEGLHDADGFYYHFFDADQRRWVTVRTPGLHSPEEVRTKLKTLVEELAVDLAPDVLSIYLDDSGKVEELKTENVYEVNSLTTYCPTLAEYQLPVGVVKTIARSEITELDRLACQVDMVSYPEMERGVFKYNHNYQGFGSIWQEINILARLPPHPHILPLHRLVVDEVTRSRVVGFTTPYIAGGDLDTNKTRPFKLKYLQQLTKVVDDLNYKFGIAHQDLAPRNLFIDPETDNLIIFNFNEAAKIGQGRYQETSPENPNRTDVKGVMLTLYKILTRDPKYSHSMSSLHELDETDVLAAPDLWVKHPDVHLDAGLDAVDYYNELMRWVHARRTRPVEDSTNISAERLDWPMRMAEPPVHGMTSYDREQAEKLNLPVIEWGRPGYKHVDRSRKLLATGKYADEGPSQQSTETARVAEEKQAEKPPAVGVKAPSGENGEGDKTSKTKRKKVTWALPDLKPASKGGDRTQPILKSPFPFQTGIPLGTIRGERMRRSARLRKRASDFM